MKEALWGVAVRAGRDAACPISARGGGGPKRVLARVSPQCGVRDDSTQREQRPGRSRDGRARGRALGQRSQRLAGAAARALRAARGRRARALRGAAPGRDGRGR